jgi:hypothetical protein
VKNIAHKFLMLSSTDKTEVQKIDLDHILMGDSSYLLEQNEKVVLPADYEIYSLNILDVNTITFTGLRYDDEIHVIAELDFQNNIRIISESTSGNIEVLDKIN